MKPKSENGSRRQFRLNQYGVLLDDYVQECIHEKITDALGHYFELRRWKMLRREDFFFLLFSVESFVDSV